MTFQLINKCLLFWTPETPENKCLLFGTDPRDAATMVLASQQRGLAASSRSSKKERFRPGNKSKPNSRKLAAGCKSAPTSCWETHSRRLTRRLFSVLRRQGYDPLDPNLECTYSPPSLSDSSGIRGSTSNLTLSKAIT